ncbi:MAG: hypothetical protein EA406_12625 [Rhodospirillales bacterium]|nr:MAG: hypothetical protein EA406_12625 [Rhodospirillales bacterium]
MGADGPALCDLPRQRLEDMAVAGAQILECYRLLGKTGGNVVAEVLRGQGEFYEWDHYPKGDVYDPETHAQYYYHAHPVSLRGGEHGHFHTFLRSRGMPADISPAPVADQREPREEGDALSHLIAISMDAHGRPVRLFTTNRWVTGEVWYRAADVIRMLDQFRMDLAYPSLPTNIWISAMIRLFRPEIEALIEARDAAMAAHHRPGGDAEAFEDHSLEVVSVLDISVDRQIGRVHAALGAPGDG